MPAVTHIARTVPPAEYEFLTFDGSNVAEMQAHIAKDEFAFYGYFYSEVDTDGNIRAYNPSAVGPAPDYYVLITPGETWGNSYTYEPDGDNPPLRIPSGWLFHWDDDGLGQQAWLHKWYQPKP